MKEAGEARRYNTLLGWLEGENYLYPEGMEIKIY